MYLLDTHVLLWWLEGSDRLSPKAKTLITHTENIIFVSAVSIWEITVKKMLGKLEAPDDLLPMIQVLDFKSLPISLQDADAIKHLPSLHNDPFDRLLIAQAKINRLTLITHDAHCLAYPIQCFDPTRHEPISGDLLSD